MTTSTPEKALSLKSMGEYLLASEITATATTLGFNLEKLRSAMDLAAVLHNDQRRKNRGTMPVDTYLTHPLRNAVRLLRVGVTDEATILATILHDTVEDGSTIFARSLGLPLSNPYHERILLSTHIASTFGIEVSNLVLSVTNTISMQNLPTKAEKRAAYVEHVTAEVGNSAKTLAIKISDFIDNAGGLHHHVEYPSMQKSLALKYFPLTKVFMDRLLDEDAVEIFGVDGADTLTLQMYSIYSRLKVLAGL